MNTNASKRLGLAEAMGGALSLFGVMEVAEEEIARASLSKAQGGDVFRAACPSSLLSGKSPELYRAHVRELAERRKRGSAKSLELGTKAEVLAAALDSSLQAPLNAAGQSLAEHLFTQLFPEQSKRVFGKEEPRKELWKGQVQEDLEQARRQVAKLRVT